MSSTFALNALLCRTLFWKKSFRRKLKRIRQSPNYSDDAFRNLSPTPVMAEDGSFWKTMREYFNKPATREPQGLIPFVKTNLHELKGSDPVLVWFGHSSYFIRVEGMNILVDPVFSRSASPVGFMVKSYRGVPQYSPEDFPEIDLMILTHDHYDHLDYSSIRKFRKKTRRYAVALGVGSHLEYWGVNLNPSQNLIGGRPKKFAAASCSLQRRPVIFRDAG
jgi:hypothetical protein